MSTGMSIMICISPAEQGIAHAELHTPQRKRKHRYQHHHQYSFLLTPLKLTSWIMTPAFPLRVVVGVFEFSR